MAGINIPAIPGQAAQAPMIAPAGPAQPGAQVAPLVLPVRHSSFTSFFNDQSKDPFRAAYAAILCRFDVTGPDTQDAATLLQIGLGNPSVPIAYLCCASLQGSTRVYVIHMLSKYTPALDGRVTPWDNKLFGFLGDSVRDIAMIVMVPNTAFDPTPATWVYDEATLTVELPTLPHGDLFAKLNANTPGAVPLRTRPLMFLPSKYATLLLNNKGCLPQQAYQILLHAFHEDNIVADMGPILNWLRISLHATQANNRGPPSPSITLSAPFLDEDLLAHREPFLSSTLTARGQPPAGLEAAIVQMASAVVNQTSEARSARLAREIEREQPTTPATKFGLLLDSLKAYLNVDDKAQLPEFWFQLAAAPKKQEFSIIREFFDAHSRTPQAFLPIAPVPTPKLLSNLTTVTFLADTPDDLKTGLHPFIAMDGSKDHRAAALDLARNFTLLVERDFSVAFQDLDRFKVPKDLRSYPVSFFDLERNLGIFGNLLASVLGDLHPLTANYRLFWDAFTCQHRQQVQHEIDVRKVIKPVHILCNIQLICFHWLAAKRAHLEPSAPTFPAILERISLALYTCPNLPVPLYQLIATRPAHSTQRGLTPLPSVPAVPGLTPSIVTSDDASQVASAVSTITGSVRTTNTSRAGTFVPNPNGDINLQ
jgi:hypothetical protein